MKLYQVFVLLVLALCLPMLGAADGKTFNDPVDVSLYTGRIKLACVGDSITAGYGNSPGKSWPEQIQKMLGQNWHIGRFGVSGATLMKNGDKPYWKEAAFQKAKEFLPQVVVIMLGTNDTKPQNWSKRKEFAPDYQALIEEFASLPSKPRIFICYPTYIAGKGNFGISNDHTQKLLPVITAVAKQSKLAVINIYKAMHAKDALIPDRVHPSDQGASVIAAEVFKALLGKSFVAE